MDGWKASNPSALDWIRTKIVCTSKFSFYVDCELNT